MQTYRSSKTGWLKIGTLLGVLLLVTGYSGRKAAGLWAGTTARSSDPVLFGLNLNTTVPAILLTLVALASLWAGWYLLLEVLTSVTADASGLLVAVPGFRRVYNWADITSLATPISSDPLATDTIAWRFSLKTPAAPVSFWQGWLYPQSRANYLYLPTALENRPALIALVEERLATPV